MSSPTLNSQATTVKISFTGQVVKNAVGADYSADAPIVNIRKAVGPFTTSVSNTSPLGADEFYSALTTVAASGNATISLQSLIDFVNQSSVSLARVKAYMIRLISTADDSTNGTACSGITVNGTGGTDLAPLPGITNVTLGNGDVLSWATNSAAGVAISGTTMNVYIANNDATHPACVQLTVIGATS